MGRTEPQPGDLVVVRTADDLLLSKIALTGVINGRDFPIVRVRWVSDDDPDGTPWPSEDVWVWREAPRGDVLSRDQYRAHIAAGPDSDSARN